MQSSDDYLCFLSLFELIRQSTRNNKKRNSNTTIDLRFQMVRRDQFRSDFSTKGLSMLGRASAEGLLQDRHQTLVQLHRYLEHAGVRGVGNRRGRWQSMDAFRRVSCHVDVPGRLPALRFP